MSVENAKQAEQIRSSLVVSPAFENLDYLPIPKAGQAQFSIREWVKNTNDDSWLFITSHSTVHHIIKPFAAMWLALCVRAIMELRPTHELPPQQLRAMLFLDELASLGKMPALEEALTEVRKFGFTTFACLQNLAQLDLHYGHDMSKVLASNFQTKLMMRVGDFDTAKSFVNLLGEEEVIEASDGQSIGIAQVRDGITVNNKRQPRHLVLTSEITNLDNFEGFLKIAGAYDIAKIKFQPKPRPKIATDFVRRSGLAIKPEEPAPEPSPPLHMPTGAPAPVDEQPEAGGRRLRF